ncbi:glycosyltransferase [Lacticaseibacillus jixianensis]|uniref:glycosyltransferase n=1 Tax=Lacticaseibacillus jixianensis TaxID=2486012 RepID=UPI000F7B3FCA|nr:glycosyltransferase [Lacticaseibacillus jixianensis]
MRIAYSLMVKKTVLGLKLPDWLLFRPCVHASGIVWERGWFRKDELIGVSQRIARLNMIRFNYLINNQWVRGLYYFVNMFAPPRVVTGVETAEYSRYHVFKQSGVPVRLVSFQFSQYILNGCSRFGLSPADVVNLYDYFCGIDYQTPVRAPAVAPRLFTAETQEGLLTRYFRQDRLLRKVRRDRQGRIVSVYDYDDQRRSRSVSFYRPTGSLANTLWFSVENGRLIHTHTTYQDQLGRGCLTAWYRNGDDHPSSLLLTDWKRQQTRSFTSEAALAGYFLDELVRRDPAAVFIVDRAADVQPAIQHMTLTAPCFAFIHAVVASKDQQVSGYYRPVADHFALWRGVITSTAEQAEALQRRWPQVQVLHANVSVLSDAQLKARVPAVAARSRHQIVMLARVDPAKNIEAAIEILQLVQENVPNATLEIWGRGHIAAFGDYQTQLERLIRSKGLTASVHFNGYTDDPAAVLDQSRVLLMTSKGEGTGLVINEALARGVPVVSYAFKYGPSEFIRDGENGYLVAADDPQRAARCVVELLLNDPVWVKRSRAARVRARRFDAAHSWQQWARVLTRIKNG